MPRQIFLDTSIGIKRIEENDIGNRVKEYLDGQDLFTSPYVLMEFKRTVLMDAISLYTLLQEEPTLDDVYWRLGRMLDDKTKEREASRWILLLGLLRYPRNKDKYMAMTRLDNYIRRGLVLEFLKKMTLLKSNVKCLSFDNKPIKSEGRYELNMECLIDGCNIKDIIIANKSTLENISIKIKGHHEPYFRDLSTILVAILDDIDNISEEHCKRLGDIIIAIDCPNEMELCSSDHHFDIICDAFEKCYYNPLKP
jgi:hypothetical protein